MDIHWSNKRKYINDNDDIDEDKNKKSKKEKYDKQEDNGMNENDNIYSYDNQVYFYSGVNTKTIIALQKEVNNTVIRMKARYRTAQDAGLRVSYEPICVHIYSGGGSIFAAFSFIDFMTQLKHRNSEMEFHSVVEGSTASAGTLMSVVFDKRVITEYGYMLIHQLSSGTWGKYADIKDDVKNMDTLMARIKMIYKMHCKVPKDKLDEILKHDIYWDAEKCLEYRLVDKIITSSKRKL